MHELPGTNVVVPIIETQRLRLRGPTLGDYDASYEMWSDAGITRFIGGRPSTPDEVWTRTLRYIGHWAALGYGFWVIEEKATGAFVGELGFADFRRGLGASFDGFPEMGWALAPEAHGKGYAGEALIATIAWGDANFNEKRAVCMIAPDNAPSIKLAEKVGFREFARTDYKGSPTILYERIR